MSTNRISDEVKEETMEIKTMEASLMLEAGTAASLKGVNSDPEKFLLLLANAVSNIARACSD